LRKCAVLLRLCEFLIGIVRSNCELLRDPAVPNR
jgi:hypothetical protein